MLDKINKTYRHIFRYKEIISVIVKYGFQDIVERLNLQKHLGIGSLPSDRTDTENLSKWSRIRLILEELGPTFIKLGQIMSSRADMLPINLLEELEKLLDRVPPYDTNEAKKLIESELNIKINDIFKIFPDKPIASASIAQVYEAELKTGEKVAVKVQRPDIEKKIKVDIEIMEHIALLMEKYVSGMNIISPTKIVDEFSKNIKKEIDFTLEMTNIQKFAKNFENDKTIYVPKIYNKLCSEKIIVMEYIDGIKVSELGLLKEKDYNIELIANRGADATLKQVFIHGFFHGDPHPGNIFVLPKNKISFIDYGLVGSLTQVQRELLNDLIIGIVTNNERKIVSTIINLSYNKNINKDALYSDISDFIDKYFYKPIEYLNIKNVLTEFVKLIIKHEIIIPQDFYLLIKVLINVEGLGAKLYPEFNIFQHIKPFTQKIIIERFNPKTLIKEGFHLIDELRSMIKNSPYEIQDLFTKFKHGNLKFKLDLHNFKSLSNVLDNITNRLIFAIVLSSIIIASSLIILSGIPPKWYEIPIIGIVGYITAGLMGFWLLISIIRHGKM